jgi:hypothetical protein
MAQRLHMQGQIVELGSLWLQFERNEHQSVELERRLGTARRSPSPEIGLPFARWDEIMICTALGFWLIVGGMGLLLG